jgi:hypothetical protein
MHRTTPISRQGASSLSGAAFPGKLVRRRHGLLAHSATRARRQSGASPRLTCCGARWAIPTTPDELRAHECAEDSETMSVQNCQSNPVPLAEFPMTSVIRKA